MLRALSYLALAAAAALSGCATAAVTGASDSIGYTFTQVAYRSFTVPKGQVHSAVLQALSKMQIQKTKDEKSDDSIEVDARTKDLTIVITMHSITPKVTKVSVNASKYLVIKDKTVAVEILTQAAQIMGVR